MFEHFGLLDIWSGIKKYKYIVTGVIVGAAILFTGKFLYNSKNTSIIKNNNEKDNIYISSATYYVEPNSGILGRSDSNFYKTMPDDYVAMLKTDFCKQYIFDNLMSIYSDEYIIKNSGLDNVEEMDLLDLNVNSMNELYSVKKVSGTMLVEISSMTYNKELSDSVIDLCEKFIISSVDNQIVNSTIRLSGETSRMIKPTDINLENIEKTDKRNIVKLPTTQKFSLISIVKRVVIPLVLVVLLCIMAIVTIGLFNPTLNRISDFSEYNVPVIGEIKGYKKTRRND